jgi:hypothetical protein
MARIVSIESGCYRAPLDFKRLEAHRVGWP